MTTSASTKTSPLILFRRMSSSLKSPAYRLYFFGTIAHFAAMSMAIVTSPLLIFRLTNSSALLGTMSLVNAGPMIAISFFGGAIADRLQKKRILLAGLLCSSAVSLFIGLSLGTGLLNKESPASWSILFITSGIQGIIMGLMMPALQAIIPEIVSRDQLMNAVALNTFGASILNLTAPGIAGFIIGTDNYKAVYYTMAALYFCAASIIFFIPARSRIIRGASNMMEEIRKGVEYIRRDSLILIILVFTLIIVVFAMPYQQLMPIFTDDILKVGARGLGVLMSVSGAGALVGSVIMAALPNKRRGLMLLGSGVLAGTALVIFSFSRSMALSLVVIFFLGLSQTFRQTIGSTVLQAHTQNDYMGRVMSILNMQWGLMSFCTFAAGMMAEVLQVQWVLGSLAMALILFSCGFLVFSPGIRKLE